ncbi:MAG: hypothetical protein R3A44_11430 [Caldilineaceae bacterium]
MRVYEANKSIGVSGALLLALSLIGYALYELMFYRAGFPTTDFAVVVAGPIRCRTLAQLGYTLSIALLMTTTQPFCNARSALRAAWSTSRAQAPLSSFVSGHIGLRILATAEATFAANPDEAIVTILLRTVTIALFEAAG